MTIDSEGSTLQTGQSTVTAAPDPGTTSTPAAAPYLAAAGGGATVRSANGEVVNEFAPHLGDRAVAIAGS